MNGTSRAAIYVRVSTSAQADNYSPETQEAECRALATQHDLDVVQVLRDVQSGADWDTRPAFTTLRAAIQQRSVDAVIVHTFDRASRDELGPLVLAWEAERAGVRLLCVKEPLDDSIAGRIMLLLSGHKAHDERSKFRERSMRGKKARIQSGRPLAPEAPPFGYRWADTAHTRYEADPAQAPIVVDCYHRAAAGESLYRIAETLSDRGLPTPRNGQHWHISLLSRMLHNPAYKGEAFGLRWRSERQPDGRRRISLRPRSEWVPLGDAVPALVDADVWEAAQERLAHNKRVAGRRLANPEQYLLRAGILRCGYCGRSMVVLKSGDRKPEYHCPALARDCPRHPSMLTETLDAQVWERVLSTLLDEDVIAGELARHQRERPDLSERQSIDSQHATVLRRIRNLTDDIADADDRAVRARLRERLAELEGEARKLAVEQDRLRLAAEAWEQAATQLHDLAHWVSTVASRLAEFGPAERRLALDALALEVRLYAADTTERWSATASLPLDGAATGFDFRTPMCWADTS